MNDIGEVGLFTPPEDPQLLSVRLDFTSPYTQQVGLHAAHEAAKNRVILGRGWDYRPVLPAAAEAVATPFDACQLRLEGKGREEKHSYYVDWQMNNVIVFCSYMEMSLK